MKYCWSSCLIFLFLCAGDLAAQIPGQILAGKQEAVKKEEVPEQKKPIAIEKRPTGIPITDISKRAQKTHIELNKMKAHLEPVSEVITITEQLPQLLYTLKSTRSGWIYKSLNRLTPRKLRKLSMEWDTRLVKLKAWDDTLAGRLGTLEEDHIRLKETDDLWQITGESIIANEAPEVINKRVKSTLGQINDIKSKLLEKTNLLLTLRDRISEEEFEITKLIGMINGAKVHSQKLLFVRDNPPFWEAVLDGGERLKFGSQLLDSFSDFMSENREYFKANRGRCILHIIFFVALSISMICFYRRKTRNRLLDKEDEISKATLFFLSRPFSTSFLISIFFGAWIHGNSVVSFRALIILLALIPFIRLVPGIFVSELHKPMYFLTGLCGLDIIEDIAGDYILLQRVLLLLITIIATPVLVWWLRPASTLYLIKSRLSYRVGLSSGILILILLVASLVISLFGVCSLAHVLISAMVQLLFGTVGIYVIGLVLDALAVLLIRKYSAQSLDIVRTYTKQMERYTISFIRYTLVFFWLRMVLRTFRLYQPTWDWFAEIVECNLILGTIEVSVGAIFGFIIILVITFVLARLVRIILDMEVFPRLRLPRGVPGAVSMIARYTIVGFGFFLAISAIGINLGRFGMLAGAIGVGLGFGLRNIIENFVSGIILIFERPIQVGDTVEVEDLLGNVAQIGIRSSTINTFDGSEVIVPNANLISNKVTNWTMSNPQRRAELPVKVAFGNNPHRVLELLLKVVREHKGVMVIPEPIATFNGFGDNYLGFTLYYWLSDNILQVKSEVALGVHDIINESGIDTPRPKGDFNLKFMNVPGNSGKGNKEK